MVLEVPPESRLGGYEGLGQDSEQFRDFAHRGAQRPPPELDPLVEKLALTLPVPTIDDPTADQERLLEGIQKRRPGTLQMGLKIARELPRVLRSKNVNRIIVEMAVGRPCHGHGRAPR